MGGSKTTVSDDGLLLRYAPPLRYVAGNLRCARVPYVAPAHSNQLFWLQRARADGAQLRSRFSSTEDSVMVPANLPAFEADYAITIRPNRPDVFQTDDLGWVERTFDWTGWTRHLWPADVVSPDRLLYGFDLRRDQRQLFALLRILKGGTFSFRSMEEFAQAVAGLIGHKPGPEDDDYSQMKWAEIQERVEKNEGKSCTGICYTLKVIKPVAIPLKGEFPRLGWCNLTLPNYGMKASTT